MTRQVLTIYWGPRQEHIDGYATRLHRFLLELGGIHAGLRPWRFEANGREANADSLEAIRSALLLSAQTWELGEEEQTAYELRLFVARAMAPPAELTITCGIEPLPLGNLFAPNRLSMAIRHDAPDDLAGTAVVHAALAAAATIFEADFGHAGSDTVPMPAMALYSPGVPPVGWMTFLSNRYPALPPKLPTPAVSYPAGKGHIVVAHPKSFRDHDKSQRQAIAAVATTLREAGVLLEWAKRAS